MKKIHYSWLICAGCTLMLFCTVGLNTTAFSVYQPFIISHSKLTNTQGSEIITIRSLAALISMLFVERFYRRIDIRLGVLAAGIGSSLGFVLFGVAESFASYCLAAVFTGVFYGLGGMIPASILIGRWFNSKRSLALGICTAGSGIATILTPPLVTGMIEKISLEFSFFSEAGFIVAAVLVVFLMLRNSPEEMGLAPLSTGEEEKKSIQPWTGSNAPREITLTMLTAVLLIGVIANLGFAHLSVLYKTEGFNSMNVAFIASFVGIALTSGKFIYGFITDRLGTYRSGYIFFGMLILGDSLCSLAGSGSFGIALIAMVCLGLGLPLATVGLSVMAADVSSPADYGSMVKSFQMAYMIGALLFGPLPGMIADATGSYVPFYALLTVLAAAAMGLVQISYRRMRKSHLANLQNELALNMAA